jgi:hypothetical protein
VEENKMDMKSRLEQEIAEAKQMIDRQTAKICTLEILLADIKWGHITVLVETPKDNERK